VDKNYCDLHKDLVFMEFNEGNFSVLKRANETLFLFLVDRRAEMAKQQLSLFFVFKSSLFTEANLVNRKSEVFKFSSTKFSFQQKD
jgi:hypothetical protein